MTFEEAKKLLIEGKSIRRKSWLNSVFIKNENDTTYIFVIDKKTDEPVIFCELYPSDDYYKTDDFYIFEN